MTTNFHIQQVLSVTCTPLKHVTYLQLTQNPQHVSELRETIDSITGTIPAWAHINDFFQHSFLTYNVAQEDEKSHYSLTPQAKRIIQPNAGFLLRYCVQRNINLRDIFSIDSNPHQTAKNPFATKWESLQELITQAKNVVALARSTSVDPHTSQRVLDLWHNNGIATDKKRRANRALTSKGKKILNHLLPTIEYGCTTQAGISDMQQFWHEYGHTDRFCDDCHTLLHRAQ